MSEALKCKVKNKFMGSSGTLYFKQWKELSLWLPIETLDEYHERWANTF